MIHNGSLNVGLLQETIYPFHLRGSKHEIAYGYQGSSVIEHISKRCKNTYKLLPLKLPNVFKQCWGCILPLTFHSTTEVNKQASCAACKTKTVISIRLDSLLRYRCEWRNPDDHGPHSPALSQGWSKQPMQLPLPVGTRLGLTRPRQVVQSA